MPALLVHPFAQGLPGGTGGGGRGRKGGTAPKGDMAPAMGSNVDGNQSGDITPHMPYPRAHQDGPMHLIDLPNAVVLPAVVVAQNAHHGDGPLVAVRRQLLPTDIHRLVRGLHQNGLHVHVLEELLPTGLCAGG